MEAWKALKIDNYPIKLGQHTNDENTRNIRLAISGKVFVCCKSIISQASCSNEMARIWNLATADIKNSNSLLMVKKHINKFVKLYPCRL